MDRKRELELRRAKLSAEQPVEWKKKVISRGDKTTTTPTAKYEMNASSIIKSPLEQAYAIGPEAVQRLSTARDMSNTELFSKSFTNRMKKFGAGAREIGNETGQFVSAMNDMVLPEAYYNKINDLTGDAYRYETYNEQQKKLAKEQELFDIQNKQFNQVKGIPGFLGDATAYAIPELLTGPVSAKGVGLVTDAVGAGLRATGRTAERESSHIAKWLAERNPEVIKKAGKFLKENINDPLKVGAQRYIGRETTGNPNRIGMAKDILAGVGTGTATGALDYDLSIGDGALSGLAGGTAGAMLAPTLSRKMDMNTKASREVIDYMKGKKYRVDPGVDLRNTAMYNKTRRFKNDDATSEIMDSYTTGNQKVVNRVTYEAMGFNKNEIDNMTTAVFDAGIKRAGKEFDSMVKGTKGFIPKKQYEQMDAHLKDMIKNPASSSSAVKEADEVLEYLKNNTNVTRDPGTGRFRKATFDGEKYQQMRSTLKDKIDTLFDSGDTTTARGLKPVLKYLDDSLEIGMKRGGKVPPKAWADARERWAMGEILKTKGINSADMDVDPHKLFKAFKRDGRMMTGAKGPVNDLMMVGKFSELERKLNEKSGVLSGTQQSKRHPAAGLLDEVGIKSHMSGYPIQYGALGMDRYKGRYKPSTFTRPLSQTGQLYPTMIDILGTGYDKVSNPKRTMKEIVEWYEKEEEDPRLPYSPLY